jgi:pimeloyl-ACP methyl ester carboxylesterase
MPTLERGNVSIYYEEFGSRSAYPVLLFAPGSLNSTVDIWHGHAAFDPTEELADQFRLIALDLRNAGRSWAPITADDDWDSYTQDHIALLDHLGVQRVHVMGQCIGGPLSMGLIRAQPARISAAVLLQPSGRVGPYDGRSGGFDRWRADLSGHPEATPRILDQMRTNLYTADFVHTVTRDFVRSCPVPLLVFPGNDDVHPFEIGKELAELAPRAEMVAEWKTGPALAAAIVRIREFLLTHTPTPAQAR